MKKICLIVVLSFTQVFYAQYFDPDYSLVSSLVFKNERIRSLHTQYRAQTTNLSTFLDAFNGWAADSVKTHEDLAGYYTLKALHSLRQNKTNTAIQFALMVKKPAALSQNKTVLNNYYFLQALIDAELKLNKKAIESLEQCNYSETTLHYQTEYLKAQNYFNLDEHKSAEVVMQKAIKEAQLVSAYDYIKCLSFLTLNATHTGNDSLALKNALKLDSALKSYKGSVNIADIQNKNLRYVSDQTSEISSYVAIEDIVNSNNLGLLYRKFGDFKNSRATLLHCIAELEKYKGQKLLPEVYTNVGLTYTFLKDYAEADKNFEKALSIYTQNENENKIAELNNIIAKNNLLAGKPLQAIENANAAINTASKTKDLLNLSASYIILSEVYSLNSDYKQAQHYFKLAADAKNEYNETQAMQLRQKGTRESEINELYYNTEKEIGNTERKELELIKIRLEAKQNEQALLLIRKENELKEKTIKTQELEREQAFRSLELLQRQLETQKYEEQLERLNKERKLKILQIEKDKGRIKLLSSQQIIHDKERALLEQERESGARVKGVLIFGLILISVFLGIVTFGMLRINRQKKVIELNNQELNTIRTNLEISYGQLEESLNEIGKQKQIIEDNNNLLIDSINYSSKIQRSLMLNEEQLRDFFSDSFVISLPRDIVGGDFHLVSKWGNKTYVAMVDCTGHGVPGSLVSIVGYQEISHILNTQYLSPAGVLRLLDSNINKLVNTDNSTFLTDGMDVMLLEIDEGTGTVTFAGARSFLLVYSNGKLTEYKGDRVSIGESGNVGFDFTESRISISEGDTIYLYTDGFQDQLREQNKKRLGSKAFKEVIATNVNAPFVNQKEALMQLLNKTKGNGRQTDDISVMAIKPRLTLNRELSLAENPKIKEIMHRYSVMQDLDGNLVVMYGEINQAAIFAILNLIEIKLKTAGYKIGVITKVKILGVEMLQNISKHQEMNNKVLPYFVVNGIKKGITLVTGNLVDEEARNFINESLLRYKRMSYADLQATYKESMRKENAMVDGNAGLGLIIIALKSNQNFEFNFVELSHGLFHFHFEVRLENIA